MIKFLMLFVLFASLRFGDAALCDSSIVKKIQDLWGPNIKSSEGLLQYLDAAGYVVVVAGTDGLVPDQDSIWCLRANIKGNTVQNINHYRNGTIVKPPSFTVEDLSTKDLYTQSTKTHIYYLPFNKDRVASFYLCDEEGSKGSPRANIVVLPGSTDVFPAYNKIAVSAYKRTWADELGVKLDKTFPDTCADH